MIVRQQPPHLVLIAQPDHAGLAAELMAVWSGGPSASRRAEDLLFAIREHDNGWHEPDATPQVEANGRPYDFMNAPLDLRQGVWPRGIGRFAHRPYAAALIAQHALTIYETHRNNPAWQRFFEDIASERDRLLHAAGCSNDSDRAAFQNDYAWLRLGDLLSLAFCNAWTEAVTFGGFHGTLADDTLTVSPDPFRGATVALRVRARTVPARPYATDQELRDTLSRTADTWLTGAAVGR